VDGGGGGEALSDVVRHAEVAEAGVWLRRGWDWWFRREGAVERWRLG
jgi:hypothetical protein